MKSLLKKSLLAASVAVAFGASAGTVNVTKQVHSQEGLKGVTANQTSNAISYTVAAAYAVGDKITFTFEDGALVNTSFPSQINVAAVNSATASSAIAGMGLGLLNSDTKSVTYRVTSLSQPNNLATPAADYTDRTTIGAVVTLGGIGYKAASLLNAPVTVTVNSETAVGDELDGSGTRTATVAEAKSQFGTVSVTDKFDQVIDVSKMRKGFVSGLTADMTYVVSNPSTTGWLNLATVNTSGVTLFGEAGQTSGLSAANFTTGGTKTFTEAAAKLEVSYAGLNTTDTITFTAPTGTAAKVLESQMFTTDYVYNYTSAGAKAGTSILATGQASGEWTLNGATVNIPYMPYSANTSAIIYITNEGTQTGDIMVTAFDQNGTEYDLGKVGVANAKTVTKSARMIRDGLDAAGFTGGKVSLTITVNAPDSDITVYAAYNAGSVRGDINTSEYKGK